MTYRTVEASSYEAYLEEEYPAGAFGSTEGRADEERERQTVVQSFPYAVVLKVAYPELDFSNRWCWKRFGPADGECVEGSSEYRVCEVPGPHSHEGRWRRRWLAKTDYDFGYNEWYFASAEDRAAFLEFVPQINWGEHYPK